MDHTVGANTASSHVDSVHFPAGRYMFLVATTRVDAGKLAKKLICVGCIHYVGALFSRMLNTNVRPVDPVYFSA